MKRPLPASRAWARLRESHRAVEDYFQALPAHELVHRPEAGGWRPLDDLRHLTLATRAVVGPLSRSGEELEARFGRAEGPSRPCGEIARAGSEALAEGAVSPPAMVPEDAGGGDADVVHAEAARAAALEAWRQAAAELEALEERWSEEELDHYAFPHPFLGALTLREWLCFNHVHARHHLQVAERRLGRNEAGSPGSG